MCQVEASFMIQCDIMLRIWSPYTPRKERLHPTIGSANHVKLQGQYLVLRTYVRVRNTRRNAQCGQIGYITNSPSTMDLGAAGTRRKEADCLTGPDNLSCHGVCKVDADDT